MDALIYLPAESSSSLLVSTKVSGVDVTPTDVSVTAAAEGTAVTLSASPTIDAGIVQELTPADVPSSLLWFDVTFTVAWSYDGADFVDVVDAMVVPGDWPGYGRVKGVRDRVLVLDTADPTFTRATIGQMLLTEALVLTRTVKIAERQWWLARSQARLQTEDCEEDMVADIMRYAVPYQPYQLLSATDEMDARLADEVCELRVAAAIYERLTIARGNLPSTGTLVSDEWRKQADAIVGSVKVRKGSYRQTGPTTYRPSRHHG